LLRKKGSFIFSTPRGEKDESKKPPIPGGEWEIKRHRVLFVFFVPL